MYQHKWIAPTQLQDLHQFLEEQFAKLKLQVSDSVSHLMNEITVLVILIAVMLILILHVEFLLLLLLQRFYIVNLQGCLYGDERQVRNRSVVGYDFFMK